MNKSVQKFCMKKIFIISICFFINNVFAQKTELIIQTGHQNEIITVSASPDGKYLLTTDNTLTSILWDIKTRTELHVITQTLAATFLDDSKSFAVINPEGYKLTMDLSGKIIQKSAQKANLADVFNIGKLYPENNIAVQDNIVINLTTNTKKAYEMPELGDNIKWTGYSAKANLMASVYRDNIELFNTLTGKKFKSISLANMEGWSVFALDFSVDGKYILYADPKQLRVFDIATGQAKTTIAAEDGNEFYRAKISPDQQSIGAISKKKIIKYNFLNGNMIWSSILPKPFTYQHPRLDFTPDAGKLIYFFEKEHFFVDYNNGNITNGWSGRINQYFTEDLVLNDGSLETKGLSSKKNAAISWDFSSGIMKMLPDYIEQYGRKKSIDTVNKITYFSQKDKLVGYDENQNKVTEFAIETSGFTGLQLSYDGKYMLSVLDKYDGSKSLNIWNVPQATLATSLNGWPYGAAFAKANNWVASVIDASANKIVICEVPSGKVITQKKVVSFDEVVNSLQFSSKDNFIAYRVRAHNVTIQSVKGDYQAVIQNSQIEGYSEFIFTKDEKYMIFTALKNKGLLFYDIQKKTFVNELAIECPMQQTRNMTLSSDGRFLFVGSAELNIQVFDLLKHKWVATLYSFVDTGDWAVTTPDGRFDATSAAEKQIYFVKGVVTYPLETLYENCYTPKLLSRILAGESFPLVNNNIDNLHPKPRIKIKYEEKTRNLEVGDDSPLYANTTGTAEITINATAPDDKVDEIRLFHNGKVVNLATRGLFVTDNDGSETKKYTINLLPGNNNFRAVALNSQRTESKADEITISYAGGNSNQPAPPVQNNNNTAVISPVDKNATMYLMVVGINTYTNKINPLTYALPDATAFKDEIEQDAKSVLTNVKTYFITDAKADKAGIVNAFNEIKRDAKPQDVFVFYYAGHGYINPVSKEFYLVSADVTDGGESLLKNGIPAKDLQQYAVDIQAQKQLFILDACQSAGAFEAMLQHDGEQQKSLSMVARSTGTQWMAASGSSETAKEFGQLGHGAFTYVLLQALKGQAATNKMITVNGMKNFLQIQVPELVKKYGSNNQYPASYGSGNDFPVELIK